MKRYLCKDLEVKRKKLSIEANPPPPYIVESGTDVVKKLLYRENYTKDDIAKCARPLLKMHKQNFGKQFDVTESIEDFDKIFAKFDVENRRPLFVIYAKSKDFWVLLCIMSDHKGNITILYNDPTGEIADKTFQEKILETIKSLNKDPADGADEQNMENNQLLKKDATDDTEGNPDKMVNKVSNISNKDVLGKGNNNLDKNIARNINIVNNDLFDGIVTDDLNNIDEIISDEPKFEFHRQSDLDSKCYYYSAPLCLRNLKIVLEAFQKNPEDLIEKFSVMQFARPKDIVTERFYVATVMCNALSEKLDYTKSISKFVRDIPLQMVKDMKYYRKVLEEEFQKDDDKVDYSKIEVSKGKYLHKDLLLKVKEDFGLNNTGKVNAPIQDYILNIEKDFPDETIDVQSIVKVLDFMNVDEHLLEILKYISKKLTVDYHLIKIFYEVNQENKCKKKSFSNINDIIEKSPKIQITPRTGGTSLELLLKEASFGMDDSDANSPEQKAEYVDVLKKKFEQVRKIYTDRVKKNDIQTIHRWSKSKKGILTEYEFCETIATMDRALNLLTRQRLTDIQIIVVLIFCCNYRLRGKLCEIHSGEGKTVIVSMLAIIKALQGFSVDVITTSSSLAAKTVYEMTSFYSIFNITVAHNNNRKEEVYKADVIYGTITNFQFDYLMDNLEGPNMRRIRKFEQVIFDEIDGMLVDNGGVISSMPTQYPGMECLRYVYIKIWQELHKAEKSFAKETETEIKKIQERCKDKNQAMTEYQKFIRKTLYEERKVIKARIKKSNPTNIPIIPAHLKRLVDFKLDGWLKSALYAKFNCHENQQYKIITNLNDEKIVIPIDSINAGVASKNAVWTDALQQFIELKHNLEVTSESFNGCSISNIGYIKNYPQMNIIGLTGTLGSRAEQKCLYDLYDIDFAKLPSSKSKKFKEYPGFVSDDVLWNVDLTVEVVEKIDEDRASLVICETEQDVLVIEKNLQILSKIDDFRLRKYTSEYEVKALEEILKIGDIIIATTMAIRSISFKAEKSLNKNGGLHVCVGFLPGNRRVEVQAFNRTEKNGTAQIIIRKSEIAVLRIEKPNPSFLKIKLKRDILEKCRLQAISDTIVKELEFKDKVLECFFKFYCDLKESNPSRCYDFALKDLKELWTFWFERKNFAAKDLDEKTPKSEFADFENRAQEIVKGKIQHNPLYSIALAEYYLRHDDHEQAKIALIHALELNKESSELLPGAHFKLFEIAVTSGGQIKEKGKKVFKNVFTIDHKQSNSNYKNDAKTHLTNAQAAIQKEIDYINKALTAGESTPNKDFENILIHDEDTNRLLKQIFSRLFCLKFIDASIETSLEQISYKEDHDIKGAIPITMKYLNRLKGKYNLNEFVTIPALYELWSIGVTLYSLEKMQNPSSATVETAENQIRTGITTLCIGFYLRPTFPMMRNVAGTLISVGIVDLIIEIICQSGKEFKLKLFVNAKFVVYAISLITLDICSVKQCSNVFTRAIKFCQTFSLMLQEHPIMTDTSMRLAKEIDRLQMFFKRSLIMVKFKKMSKAEQLEQLIQLKNDGNLEIFNYLGGEKKLAYLKELERTGALRVLTNMDLVGDNMKKSIANTTTKLSCGIVDEQVVGPLIQNTFGGITTDIRDKFDNKLEESISQRPSVMEKLQNTSEDKVRLVVGDFIGSETFVNMAVALGSYVVSKFGGTFVEALTLTEGVAEGATELALYADQFVTHLETKLSGGNPNSNPDVGLLVKSICKQVADQMQAFVNSVIKDMKTDIEHMKNLTTVTSVQDNPYSVFGLPLKTPIKLVKRTFRRLLLKYHPDKNPNDLFALVKFRLTVKAYNAIVDKYNKCNKLLCREVLKKYNLD